MKAKKSLGQHFLSDKNILNRIVSTASVLPEDLVLEIGPGTGNLTGEILETGCYLIAVEKDENLAKDLEEKFNHYVDSGKLKIVAGNILDSDLENLTQNKEYKVVANIPYYITGAIIRKFLESNHQPKSMTLLVQREVAERIVAKDGKESLLSLSVNVYGNPKIVRVVKRGSFAPMPNVDSAIIYISDISKENFKNISEKKFFEMLKTGFAHNRKILIGNLAKVYKKESLEKIFDELDISRNVRAEDLNLNNWIHLSLKLQAGQNRTQG